MDSALLCPVDTPAFSFIAHCDSAMGERCKCEQTFGGEETQNVFIFS